MREPIIELLESRQLLAAAPFTVGGSPLVHAEDFRVTTFATGLNYPDGMTVLSDGSLLVATSKPTDAAGYFGAADGQLVRLFDQNGDGVADGSQVLADILPRELTDVRTAGNFVLVTQRR